MLHGTFGFTLAFGGSERCLGHFLSLDSLMMCLWEPGLMLNNGRTLRCWPRSRSSKWEDLVHFSEGTK